MKMKFSKVIRNENICYIRMNLGMRRKRDEIKNKAHENAANQGRLNGENSLGYSLAGGL